MKTKKLLFVLIVISSLFSFNQALMKGSGSYTTLNIGKDETYRTLSITIVNATIYDDRCSLCDGTIYFDIILENTTYNSPETFVVNAPKNISVNWLKEVNISFLTDSFEIEVRDNGDGVTNNPDYLGNFNITNLAVGTVAKSYNTSFAIGGSPDPQATVYVKTVVTDHSAYVDPVIDVFSSLNSTYKIPSGTLSKFQYL